MMAKERPIPMNGESVRGILAGRKIQTRRVIKPQPEYEDGYRYWWKGDWDTRGGPRAGVCTHGSPGNGEPTWTRDEIIEHCPYGVVGDRLWVKETLVAYEVDDIQATCACYEIDEKPVGSVWQWRKDKLPAIFMPKWAARIWLEITGIRVERVQEIWETHIISEGSPEFESLSKIDDLYIARLNWFKSLWDSLNAKRGYYYETFWVPQKALKAGYYDIIFEPGNEPQRWRYWPPFKDKLTGDYVGPCIGEDPEALTLDIADPSQIKFIMEKGEQVGMKKKKVRITTHKKSGYGWDKNPWVWVIEFKKIERK